MVIFWSTLSIFIMFKIDFKLYSFDHGTIFITKVQHQISCPFLLSRLSLYMYTLLLFLVVEEASTQTTLVIKLAHCLARLCTTNLDKRTPIIFISKFIEEQKKGKISRTKVRKSTHLMFEVEMFTHLILRVRNQILHCIIRDYLKDDLYAKNSKMKVQNLGNDQNSDFKKISKI